MERAPRPRSTLSSGSPAADLPFAVRRVRNAARGAAKGPSIGVALGVALVAVVACKESTPPRPSEEPFKLTAERPLPSDNDAAVLPENAPVPLPSSSGNDETAPTSGARPVAITVDAGAVGECPAQRKNLPTDIDITAEPLVRGRDAGAAASEVRFVLKNRRGIPRSIQVTELDRLIVLGGPPVPEPLHIAKVTFEQARRQQRWASAASSPSRWRRRRPSHAQRHSPATPGFVIVSCHSLSRRRP